MVSISLVTSRTFAGACLDEWAKLEGKSRHHVLRGGRKAVWVPASVLQPARERLRKQGVVNDEQ
jgi:hypothetical protein